MGYAIGAIVLLNLLFFAFIYGAGKANKAWDEGMEKHFGSPEPYGPEDIIEQGRSQIKKNQDAFWIFVAIRKLFNRKKHGHS